MKLSTAMINSKRIVGLTVLGLAFMTNSFLMSSRPKITIKGDSIVREGTLAEYQVVIENVSGCEYSDSVIDFRESDVSLMKLTEISSDQPGIVVAQGKGNSVSVKRFLRDATLSFKLKTKAELLPLDHAMKSLKLKVLLRAKKLRETTKEQDITLYKPVVIA